MACYGRSLQRWQTSTRVEHTRLTATCKLLTLLSCCLTQRHKHQNVRSKLLWNTCTQWSIVKQGAYHFVATHSMLPSLSPCQSHSQVNAEVEDMYKEFQREKEDLLESVRMLQDQMQLKDMVIEAFIPPEEVQKVREGGTGAG